MDTFPRHDGSRSIDLPATFEKRGTKMIVTVTTIITAVITTLITIGIPAGIGWLNKTALLEEFTDLITGNQITDVYSALSLVERGSFAEQYVLVLTQLWQATHFAGHTQYADSLTESEGRSVKLHWPFGQSYELDYPELPGLPKDASFEGGEAYRMDRFVLGDSGLISRFDINRIPVEILVETNEGFYGNSGGTAVMSTGTDMTTADNPPFLIVKRGQLWSPTLDSTLVTFRMEPHVNVDNRDVVITGHPVVMDVYEIEVSGEVITSPKSNYWGGSYGAISLDSTSGFVKFCVKLATSEEQESASKMASIPETCHWIHV